MYFGFVWLGIEGMVRRFWFVGEWVVVVVVVLMESGKGWDLYIFVLFF